MRKRLGKDTFFLRIIRAFAAVFMLVFNNFSRGRGQRRAIVYKTSINLRIFLAPDVLPAYLCPVARFPAFGRDRDRAPGCPARDERGNLGEAV